MTTTGDVQRLFEAFGAGDMETVTSLLADDFSFELAGTSRFAGRTTGRDKVLALLGDLMQTTGMQNEVIGMHQAGDDVIVHQRGRANNGYEDESLLLISSRDGKIASMKEFLFDVAAFDAFVA
jgi:ketosteroid isomerase-like protein